MENKDYMDIALNEAKLAFKEGEVPVGAIILFEDKIIAKAHNTRKRDNMISSHAEINAINEACRVLGHPNLEGASMFVTLEPCPMCAYAIMEAHIDNLYIGAYDLKRGAISNLDIFNKHLGSKVNVYDIINEESSILLKEFFKERR